MLQFSKGLSMPRHEVRSWRLARAAKANCAPPGASIFRAKAIVNFTGVHPMSISAFRKQELIKDYATKPGDTGSPEMQGAILTERITKLTDHFKTQNKE